MKTITNDDLNNPEQLDAAYAAVLDEAQAIDIDKLRRVNLDVDFATSLVMSHYDKVMEVGDKVEEVLNCTGITAMGKTGLYTLAVHRADKIYQVAFIDHVNGDLDDDPFYEMTRIRDRMFTLFINNYASIRRALCYLFWDTDKGDSILPPLFPQDDETRSYFTETYDSTAEKEPIN